jgi:hypothetical protein
MPRGERKMIVRALHRPILHTILLGIALLGLSLSASAEDELEYDPLAAFGSEGDTKNELVKIYCRNDGKLVQCVGLHGSDCASAISPIVDTCYAQAKSKTAKERAADFSSCFSQSFNKRYTNKIQNTPDCVKPSRGDLRPMTPELAARSRPAKEFHAEEALKGKKARKTTAQAAKPAVDAVQF